MRLLIISHTPHYQADGSVVGWGPTLREIDHLAALFDAVTHLAPLHPGAAPSSTLPYSANNVHFESVKPAGGDRFLEKSPIFLRIPGWLKAFRKAISQADAIHIRCPAGISLVGLLAARWWGKEKPVWVKYAGNWHPDHEPISYSFQRLWLRNNFHKGTVTVNGQWPNQPDHILSFINPSFSVNEYKAAGQFGLEKSLVEPINLLFVGRIERAKGAGRVIEIARILEKTNLNFKLTLIGDGDYKTQLEDQIHSDELGHKITFTGWLNQSEIKQHYQQAHFIVHPSKASEGWPKVLSEAMAHGAVPIASTVSSIPMILAAAQAGLAFPPSDLKAYTDAILRYTKEVDSWKQASLNGIRAAKQFTYKQYLEDVRSMFKHYFEIELKHE